MRVNSKMMGEDNVTTNADISSLTLRKLLRSRWDVDSRIWIERDLPTSTGTDWDALLAAARQARVSPLMHLILHNREWVPTRVRSALRMDLFNVARQNLIALNALATVLQAFNEDGIPHILLKGAALALTLYHNEGLRPMCDADLLVHHEDVQHAATILNQCGYDETGHNMEERPGANLSFENELVFMPDNPDCTPIELHWGFFNALHYANRITQDWLWATAEPLRINTLPTLVLGSEALLLHLCGHLLLHHSDSLKNADMIWFHDIALLLSEKAEVIHWETLFSKAVEWDLITPLQVLLPKIVDEWKTPVPEKVLEKLSSLSPSKTEQRVVRWLTSTDKKHTGLNVWMNSRAIATLPQRVNYIATQIFPSLDYMRERYGMPHPWLLPFYYIYRFLKGIGITK